MQKTCVVIIFCLLINILYLVAAEISCSIESENGKLRRPRITKVFGQNREIQIPYDVSKVIFYNEDVIKIYCASGITGSANLYNDYTCDMYNYPDPIQVSCNELKLVLKESQVPFDWCDLKAYRASYIMKIDKLNDISLAEICYSFDKMTPTIMYYSVPKLYNDHNNLSLIADLFNNKPIYSTHVPQAREDSVTNLLTDRSSSVWAEFEKFEYNSLIQNTIINDIQSVGSLIDVIWWRNLRIWNWAKYMQALNKQSEKSIFRILAGSSGVVSGPEEPESCSDKFVEIHIPPENKTIPTYIWNIVQELNGTQLFVVIGFNSPYYELFEPNEQMLCNDMCHEIEWLKQETTYFKAAIFGRIFCCALSEVQQLGILDGFPLKLPCEEHTEIISG